MMRTSFPTALYLTALLAAACGSGENPVPATTSEPAPATAAASSVERIPPQYEMRKKETFRPCPGNEDEVCARFMLEYPEFKSAANTRVLEALNQDVLETLLAPSFSEGPAASLEALEDEFFEEYENSAAERSESRYFDERTVNVVHQEAGVLSLELAHSSFYAAAHPNYGRAYHVLDITTGQRFTLEDLFIDGWKERFHTLGEAAFRRVRKLAPDASLEKEGFFFEGGIFQLTDNFAVVSEGILFFYSPYEIGPWVFGSTEFVIPWGEFGDLILAGGPLGAIED